MTVTDAIRKFGLRVFAEGQRSQAELTDAYVSDMLSDVMGSAKSTQVWITIHVHVNIIAVAVLKDLPAVIITKGKNPDSDAVQKAKDEGVYLLGTDKSTFDFAGILFNELRKAG